MKHILMILLAVLVTLSGCTAVSPESGKPAGKDGDDILIKPDKSEEEQTSMMRMKINGTPVTVAWEDNESAAALKELAAGGLEIRMSMYGGFEQVGSIGQRLPASDVQTTTSSGDIVLYSGSQLVVFYGSNSWAYTRLGHITDKTPEEMRALQGSGDVTVTLSVE